VDGRPVGSRRSNLRPIGPVLLLGSLAGAGAAHQVPGELGPGVRAAPDGAPPPSEVREGVRVFLERLDRRAELWPSAQAQLGELLDELDRCWKSEPPPLAEVGGALLSVASYAMARPPTPADYAGGEPRHVVRRAGKEHLDRALEGERGAQLLEWMAGEVLVLSGHHPVEQRYLALAELTARRTPRAKLALLTIARDEGDPLRSAVLELLPTWPDDAIDSFLVGLLDKKVDRRSGPHPFNLVLKRIRDWEAPLGSRASDLLVRRLAALLLSTDWRDASRAIELSRGLVYERSVPMLIDALATWQRRQEKGTGSKRILNEVARELRRISGRSIGLNPQSWTTWWIAVRQGRVAVPAYGEDPLKDRTQATFFGLQPISDRVTFIIDCSGSMKWGWGTEGHARFEEAIEQLMHYLQAAGEDTRFNVILFNSEPVRSSSHLVAATADTLERARASLLRRQPDGGTYLRPAVEMALQLDQAGGFDPARLEADTIVILCDGETTDGPGWVAPLLERIAAEARVVFHCALIGHAGDGTLQQLAEGTGGDFIRVGG